MTNETVVFESRQHNTDQEFKEFIPSEAMVKNEVRIYSEIVVDLTFTFIVSFVGIITNMLIILVFGKQGFKDSVSISMTTIALWDFLKCVGAFMQRLTGPMSLFWPAHAFSWTNICVVVFNYLNSFSSYVTSVLAAYVAIERCMCVTIPMKVKWLLTRKVSITICITVSLVVFGWFLVVFGMYDITWVFHPRFNETVAVYNYNSFSTNNTVLFEYYNLSGILWPLASLVVIIIADVTISYKLRQASKFRQTQSGGGGDNLSSKKSTSGGPKRMNDRDQQVVKMLLVITAIYVVTLTPREACYIAKYFSSEFYFLKKYHNIFMLVVHWVIFCDTINGAVNLIVFVSMSSSFRAQFIKLFPCLEDKN